MNIESTSSVVLSTGNARRLTDRIRIAIDGSWELIRDAYQGRVWVSLGYDSWDDYSNSEFGGSRIKLPREDRTVQVLSLRESGLSIRAIASGLGISDQTVQRDLSGVVNHYTSPAAPDQFDRDVADATAAVLPPELTFNPDTGELLEDGTESEPVTSIITETHTLKTVTGIDGKQYTSKPREPKPTVLVGDAAAQLNRVEGMQNFSRALFTLWQLTFPTYREYLVAEVWPLAGEMVPPDDRERATPNTFRAIAVALNDLANEWENQR